LLALTNSMILVVEAEVDAVGVDAVTVVVTEVEDPVAGEGVDIIPITRLNGTVVTIDTSLSLFAAVAVGCQYDSKCCVVLVR